MSEKPRLSRHDDRRGSMVGLSFLWDEVPAVLEYLHHHAGLTPEDWKDIGRRIEVEVDFLEFIPYPTDPLGPVEAGNESGT